MSVDAVEAFLAQFRPNVVVSQSNESAALGNLALLRSLGEPQVQGWVWRVRTRGESGRICVWSRFHAFLRHMAVACVPPENELVICD